MTSYSLLTLLLIGGLQEAEMFCIVGDATVVFANCFRCEHGGFRQQVVEVGPADG
jgi:hypothetical protein